MTLTKHKMVAEIGHRTRLRNRDVQAVIETLIEVWTEELVRGERIEIEHFVVMEVQTIERPHSRLLPKHKFRRITVRTSKALRKKLNGRT